MPDRIIRDELLTSERYWSVSIQAQQLYIHILLVADDAARFSGKNFTIRATCFPGRPLEHAAMEKMLAELIDADLIRAYVVASERYLFVPRFRNRRRYFAASKYPTPPNEINDLPIKKADSRLTQVIPKSRGVGVGVGVGEEIVPTALVVKDDAYRIPNCPFQELKDIYHATCISLPKMRIDTMMRQKHCRARWVEVCAKEKWGKDEALDWFKWFFAEAERSDFLTGRAKGNTRAWTADFQWLMTAGNFAKVIEGKYCREK